MDAVSVRSFLAEICVGMQMNSINAKVDISDFEIYGNFLNIRIDDYWLDERLDELYPGRLYKGLVPTLLDWMVHETEKEIVWKRISPAQNQRVVCPILMCPDDCDFSCTIIVAEIENCDETIRWKRLGLNTTTSFAPELVGSDVEWFDKIGPYEFSTEQYIQLLADFESQTRD